ncbi:MAG TPA: NADH-quinone oxidoreductase subunit NuoB [Desulfobulbus sp.]|nr:NADH-quinone oxidoreductase subunit NuoB [Desulfobulbus sp.]
MIKILRERFRQGYRTSPFPKEEPVLSKRFRGLPRLDTALCKTDCNACVEGCPTGAFTRQNGKTILDLGRCLFCADCAACPHGALSFSGDYRLAAGNRQDLHFTGDTTTLAKALEEKTLAMFGRSLKLRVVSAGGCNACEADVNVLGTLVFDLARFGINFVAAPRHADGMLLTGPVSENMRAAVLSTWEAIPDPKIVIATGSCAIDGGPYINSPEINNGVDKLLPVDLYIPGCPPHPYTILDGLLRILDMRG